MVRFLGRLNEVFEETSWAYSVMILLLISYSGNEWLIIKYIYSVRGSACVANAIYNGLL